MSGLAIEDLRRLARSFAEDEAAWLPHVEHDPDRRIFRKLLDGDEATVWLICWMPGHDTGFHDHDGSAGAVSVLQGQVREERLRWAEEPVSAIFGPGELLEFGPADIHRVRHHGDEPTVTLHAYSPALKRMGAYVADEHGRLLRHALDEDEELRAAS